MEKKSYSIQEIATVLDQSLNEADTEVFSGSPRIDSRFIEPGDIFVAIKGSASDGHDYIAAAEKGGASCVIYQDSSYQTTVPGILVTDTRLAWSRLSAWYHEHPSEKLHCIGVTGTNGKTTIQWMISGLFTMLAGSVLRVGTLGAYCSASELNEECLTTPDAFDLEAYCKSAVIAGTRHAVFEVSSHALSQRRVDSIPFKGAVFSNLSRDHLDYHHTEEEYYTAKKRLFELLQHQSGAYATICIDCPFGKRLSTECDAAIAVSTYGTHEQADLRISDFEQSFSGSSFTLGYKGDSYAIKTAYIGLHNARNIAAAFLSVLHSGFEASDIVTALGKLGPVPGRLEAVGNENYGVFVDYAHTPDALDNVLQYVKPLVSGKLFVLFGCGGDRDRGKRPQMAAIAARLADVVCVTSDNPRTEDPQAIIDDILSEGLQPGMVDVDRRAAIQKSLSMMTVGDVLLIAGKGHEDYQILGTEKIHFSDQEIVREYFESAS